MAGWGVSEAGLVFCRGVSQLAARAHVPGPELCGIAMEGPNSSAISFTSVNFSAQAFCNASTCFITSTEVSCLARALAADRLVGNMRS
jgi:hypothetical protein